MNDKKHIDRLFQERFKDFEAVPSDAVWVVCDLHVWYAVHVVQVGWYSTQCAGLGWSTEWIARFERSI